MSQILFLGTGAADWDISQRNGFFRRNSAALINNELMVDCGAHIFDFAESTGKENFYDKVTDIIITHNHGDHFCKTSLLKLAEKQKLRVGCNKHVAESIGEHQNIDYVLLSPFEMQKVGEYEIIPLPANHQMVIEGDYCPLHYIIKTPDGRNIFYGLDGAWFLRPSWEEMKKHKYDMMVFDCTVGDFNDWRFCEHNTIPMLRIMVDEIKKEELINGKGLLVASHFARTLHDSHEKTKEILEKHNIIAAYDGMEEVF